MIEHQFKNTTVLDIASSIVELEPVELRGYTCALTDAPEFLFEHSLPTMVRREGVVHVDTADYVRFKDVARDAFLRDDQTYLRMRRHYVVVSAEMDSLLKQGGAASHDSVPRLYQLFKSLMCFTALNWLLPSEEFGVRLGQTLGIEASDASVILGALSYSEVRPHFLELQLKKIECAAKMRTGDSSASVTYAREYGHLHDMQFWSQPWEQPHFVELKVAAELADEKLEVAAARLLDAREAAHRRQCDAISFIELRAIDDASRLEALRIARYMTLFSTLEEYRHIAQRHVMRVLRARAHSLGLRPGQVTPMALGIN